MRTILRRDFCEVNGQTFSRKTGTLQWTKRISTPSYSKPPPSSSPCNLSLVHQKQGPGEPLHWSLFVARENQPGYIYQVKGDSEHMTYLPRGKAVNIVLSRSFYSIYDLAEITEQQGNLTREVVEQEVPPQAKNRKCVKENCQGWTIRVITKLVEKGIVPAAKLQMAKNMLQQV